MQCYRGDLKVQFPNTSISLFTQAVEPCASSIGKKKSVEEFLHKCGQIVFLYYENSNLHNEAKTRL